MARKSKRDKVCNEDETIRIGIINLSDNPNSRLTIRIGSPNGEVRKITKGYLSVHEISRDELRWRDFEVSVKDYWVGTIASFRDECHKESLEIQGGESK